MRYTLSTLPTTSPNPFTRFGLACQPGDTLDLSRTEDGTELVTCSAVQITGPSTNPYAYRRVTFHGYGDTWTTEYPNR